MEADTRPVNGGATYLRPLDWARVDTSIGTMIEPFSTPFARHNVGTQSSAYNATDEASMVNAIEYIDMDKAVTILSSGGVHSANVGLRTGR